MSNLIGKNVLIVDEVDDTRTTLEYAVRELQKDVHEAQKELGREGEKTTFAIFVLHVGFFLSHLASRSICWILRSEAHSLTAISTQQNKDKQKKGKLPSDMMDEGRYLAAVTTGDVWICYPWEAAYVSPPPIPVHFSRRDKGLTNTAPTTIVISTNTTAMPTRIQSYSAGLPVSSSRQAFKRST